MRARDLWVSLLRQREPVLEAARAAGAVVTHRYGRLVSGFSARMEAGEAEMVAGLPGVASVEPAAVVRMYAGTGEDRAAASSRVGGKVSGGRGIRVAVIDSGVDYTHAAFGGKGTRAAYDRNDPDRIERGSFPTSKVIGGYDFVGDDYAVTDWSTSNDVPEPDPDPLDRQGHGTHVASICCGKRSGEVKPGIAPKAKILAYKVWAHGDSTADVLVAAFERAVDPNGDGSFADKPHVINFSGGVNFGTEGAAESVAAQRAVDLGVVVVAAAGNAGNEIAGGRAYRVGAPATAPGVIAVAAHDETTRIAVFSSQGPSRGGALLKPDISALGVGVMAAAVGSGTRGAILSGTSMAAPQVSGGAALLRERRPGWAPVRIKAALMNHAGGVQGPKGKKAPATVKGAGRMRVGRSLGTESLAWPSSISFGRVFASDPEVLISTPVTVKNLTGRPRTYTARGRFAVAELGQVPFALEVISEDGTSTPRFKLAPRGSKVLRLKLTFDPSLVLPVGRMLPWYGKHPDVDGALTIETHYLNTKKLRIPWHIVPVASTDISASPTSLVLAEGDSEVISVVSEDGYEHVDA